MTNEGIPNSGKENKEGISLRVLYAEDTESLRKITVRQLEAMGVLVEAVENGQLLLKKLETGEYDIVLTDNDMPGTSGIEALQEIRKNEKIKNIPVIVFTSGGLAVQLMTEDAGGVYMAKGTPMKNVFLKMVSLIESRNQ